MAAPSYTYSLANGTTADASQVMQNFTDILNGVSDGTKDLSINALTCAGTVTLNGNTTIGNASSDDLTVTASLASSIPIKTTNSYNIGSSTLGLASIYLGANSQTVRILPSGSMSATWTLTLPTTAGTNNYALTTNGSGTTSWTAVGLLGSANTWTTAQTFNSGVVVDDAAGQSTLNYYRESTTSSTFTFNGSGSPGTSGSVTLKYTRVGNVVTLRVPSVAATTGTGSTSLTANTAIDSWARPPSNITVACARIRENGSADTVAGEAVVTSAGVVTINRRPGGTGAWSDATSCGTEADFNLSWVVD